ncbi:MAG: hypothetical protein J5J06_09215 [Phycisphaerae bacterium]|nr:hypothetical protein [Phycisphaerae bacterium]
MYGSLLVAVGCLLIALAFVMFRWNAAARGRFRGAMQVTGEVVDVAPMTPRAAKVRVRFDFKDRSHLIVLSARWNSGEGEWYLGGSEVAEQIRLFVPPDSPEDAAPAVDVKVLYAEPVGVGLFGFAAIGFGLVLLTESLAAVIILVGGMWLVGLALFIYFIVNR